MLHFPPGALADMEQKIADMDEGANALMSELKEHRRNGLDEVEILINLMKTIRESMYELSPEMRAEASAAAISRLLVRLSKFDDELTLGMS